MLKRILTTGIIALGVLASPAVGQEKEFPPEGGEPQDFNIPTGQEYTLGNGLRVTMVPYGTLPKVSVRLVVRSGNLNEAADEVWLADLTGDLMKEGTPSRSAQDIAREAALMGGTLSIGTGMDQTWIGADVFSEAAPELVALMANVVLQPAFPESELARLLTDRIRQVSVAKQRPRSLTLETFRSTMYPDHPYGRIYPTEEMLRSYTVADIRAFYQQNFGAARSHIYVAGVFDPSAVQAAIQASFGDWQTGEPPLINIPNPVTARKIHLIDRPDAVQSTIYMGLPVVDPSHEDYIALQVTNSLLGGSFSSRITSNIREDKGYTYSPVSSVSTRYRDAYWIQVADVATDVTGASFKEIFYEIDRLQNEPPSEDELLSIKNYMGGVFVLQNSSRGGIIGQLANRNLHDLPDDYISTYVQKVYSVTADAVEQIMQTYIRPEQMLIVVTGDKVTVEPQLEDYGPVVP